MAKLYDKGAVNFGMSYNYTTAVPVDTRMVVKDTSNLLDPLTWFGGTTYNTTDDTKNGYTIYKGLNVTVLDSSTTYVYVGSEVSANKIKDLSSWSELSRGVALKYVEANASIGAHIALVDSNNNEISSISASNIVGNGSLNSASYESSTNTLVLHYNTATGGTSDVSVDMKKLIDIDDIFIDNDSSQYINVVANSSVATFGVTIQDVSTASATSTGLADAYQTKQYIDDKITSVTISASGDNYINAANVDKVINVSANIDTVEVSTGVRGVWNVSTNGTATLTGETDPTISGTANKLLDSNQAITAIKTYVDAKVQQSNARTDASIDGAVKKLDKALTTAISDNHITIKYSEADGIVTIDASTADIASAALLGTTSDTSTDATAFGYIKALRDEMSWSVI